MKRCLLTFLLVGTTFAAVESRVTLEVDGDRVEILRDHYGVPHIFAGTERGVYVANGYAIAQDRLLQMDSFRRAARGELAELLGPGRLAADREVRMLGYSDAEREATLRSLPERYQQMLVAYAEGVNRWIEEAALTNKLPVETLLIGRPRPWRAIDTIAIAEMMARRFGSGGGAELRNQAMHDYLQRRFKDPRTAMTVFNDLLFTNDPRSPTTVRDSRRPPPSPAGNPTFLGRSSSALLARAADRAEQRAALTAATELGLPTRFGSYAVVIAPERSATGNPILVGGPQMGFSTPQIAHEVHLVAPGLNVMGMGFAGTPGVLIGMNEHLAWTTTSGVADLEDIFAEKLNPANSRQYWHNGAWRDMDSRTETIRVRGGQPVTLEVLRTVHGPVLEVDTKNHLAYAKAMTYWQREMGALLAIAAFNRARDVREFAAAAPHIPTTHNFFVATRDGAIGYWFCGRAPIRSTRVDTRLPTPGTGEFDWQGTLSFAQMPQGINPRSGYFTNWNNKPAAWWRNEDTPTWGELFRIHRIENLIARKPRLTFDDVRKLVADIGTYDMNADHLLTVALPALRRSAAVKADPLAAQALAVLEAWDRHGDDGSIGKLIFETLLAQVRDAIFLDDLGDLGDRRLFNLAAQPTLILHALQGRKASVRLQHDFLNGKSADAVIADAFLAAVTKLKAERGDDLLRWNYTQGAIRFGSLPPMPQTNRGTYIQIVEVGKSGMRGVNILPPGQSESSTSPHFGDQRELAGRFAFKPMRLTREEVEK